MEKRLIKADGCFVCLGSLCLGLLCGKVGSKVGNIKDISDWSSIEYGKQFTKLGNAGIYMQSEG